jgi:predicted nucleotidyltransferase
MKVSLVLQCMLERVAIALGPELCQQMTFVGGCTTGLLLTDEYTLEQVRHTDDVDLIVHTMGYNAFHALQKKLKEQGFSIPASTDDAPICAMNLGDLRVDFMPDDDSLGFTNRWYKDAMATASPYSLTGSLSIRLISPVYFVATKLEAYNGRGNNDPLGSRDVEDILNLVDGREELLDEIKAASVEVQSYIANEISRLLDLSNFEYAVQSQAGGNTEREDVIFERLDAFAALAPGESL